MPSDEVAAAVELVETATNLPLPKVTDCQLADVGKVRSVQLMPSGELAAVVPGP